MKSLELLLKLAQASGGSCNCMTKNNDIEYHSKYCAFRVITEAYDFIREQVDKDAKIHHFLNRVGDGYFELSQDKVRGEYQYFKKRAKELLWELKNEDPMYERSPSGVQPNDDF